MSKHLSNSDPQSGLAITSRWEAPAGQVPASATTPIRLQRAPGTQGGGTTVKERQAEVTVKERSKVKRPRMYKVIMLNDSFTPMEFVVAVLQRFFGMEQTRAVKVMLTIHNEGQAPVGVYSLDIAQTKLTQVMSFAREHQHPLRCVLVTE